MRKNYYKKQSKGILDGSLTKKISDRNVPWPKCTVTEMFCDRNVPWPKCSLTKKFHDRNVLWPKCSMTKMFSDRKVLWPKCSLTEKIRDRNVLWPKSSDRNVPLPKCVWPKCETGKRKPYYPPYRKTKISKLYNYIYIINRSGLAGVNIVKEKIKGYLTKYNVFKKEDEDSLLQSLSKIS